MSQDVKKILLVDDQTEFLDAAFSILTVLATDRWEIHTATNVGVAMNLIAQHMIDLVVLDIHMPVVDGLQFLTLLNRKHPDVLTAVLTGSATEDHRALCLSRGAELYLQKPQSHGEWEILFESLNAIVRFKPEEGFRGVLRRVSLADVLQMECLSRHSVVLEISTREARGQIYIQDGQVIHAEVGERTGEEAFHFLATLSGGEFAQKPFVAPPERTISSSWEFLLMEAARQRDEIGDFTPADTATILTKVDGKGHTSFFTRPPKPAPKPATQPEVTEFVIFSSQGDLLYQWQCRDIPGRVGFLEFVSQKARQLSQGLPLGSFEGFEIYGSKSRVITQMQGDHAVFVRTNLLPIENQ